MIVVDLAWVGASNLLPPLRPLPWIDASDRRPSHALAGFLGVLFLASGGAAADNAANFWVSCSDWSPAEARTVCGETSAAAAFGFLGWLGREQTPSNLRVDVVLTPHASVGIPDHAARDPDYPGQPRELHLAALRQGNVPHLRQRSACHTRYHRRVQAHGA